MFARDPDDGDQRQVFSRRALLLGGLQIGAFAGLTGRLWQLQVTEENRYALLAEENRIAVQMIAPARGRILDRNGDLLAGNEESHRALLLPSLARDVKAALQRFAHLVPLSLEEQERIAARARRQSPNVPIVIAQDLTFESIAAINLQSPLLPGISTEPAPKRRYIQGRAMGHVIGYVGAHQRLALDDDPALRLPGSRIGKAGIERGMEATLRGKAGIVHSEVDSRGRIVRHLDRLEPTAGRDVVVTVDSKLQAEVMALLAQHRRAAGVVVEVETGEVLAMASVPGFDPNEAIAGRNVRRWNRLQTERDDPMNSRAARGLYPPGSTFKMVTGLAGLEAGVIDLKEKIGCDGRFDYYEQTYRCWNRSGHGTCDFHRALRESCDCYFYEVARRVGITAIATMARRLGLGQTYDCGLANLKTGIIPDPDWKRGRFNRGWFGGETILAGIGQGYVLTTPLQLAVMTARLATGRSIQPTFVRQTEPGTRPLPSVLPIRSEFLAAVRRGMAAVVNEDGGTGSKARPEAGSFVVAGKTGTSQVSRFSSETAQMDLKWELRDHALFVSYAPATRPRFALATVVEHGGGGGATAAPLSRQILDAVMARDDPTPAFRSEAGDDARDGRTNRGRAG